MPESQPVPDEAVRTCMSPPFFGEEAAVRQVLEAAAPFIRAQAIRDVIAALQHVHWHDNGFRAAADFIKRVHERGNL